MGETVPWSNFSLPPVSSTRSFFQSNGPHCWRRSSCDFLPMDSFSLIQGRPAEWKLREISFVMFARCICLFAWVTKLNHYGLFLRYLVECLARLSWAHEYLLFCLYYVSSNLAATTDPNLHVIRSRLPSNVTFVPEIRRFLPQAVGSHFNKGQVELVNGTVNFNIYIYMICWS